TIDAAQALQLGDEIGSVTPGKAADLAVWRADPLTTHLQPSDLDTVWARGGPHRPSELLQAHVAP
ncbi:MAG: amidohydrolase family protein, partial [Clostridia bacterium]